MSKKSKSEEFDQNTYHVTVTGRNVSITPALKEYVTEKLLKLEKFSHRGVDAAVTMDIQKIDHRVDIVLKVDHIRIKSHAITEDLYASIDKAVDRLAAQLSKYKTKIQNHQLKPQYAEKLKVSILRSADETEEDQLFEVNAEIEAENGNRLLDVYVPHKIVAREHMELSMLTDGEAIMKLELSGDPFLMYRSEETNRITLMYRREDGDFAVVEPV